MGANGLITDGGFASGGQAGIMLEEDEACMVARNKDAWARGKAAKL